MRAFLCIVLAFCCIGLQGQDYKVRREVRGMVTKPNGKRYRTFIIINIADKTGNFIPVTRNNSNEHFYIAQVGDTVEYTFLGKKLKTQVPSTGDINIVIPNKGEPWLSVIRQDEIPESSGNDEQLAVYTMGNEPAYALNNNISRNYTLYDRNRYQYTLDISRAPQWNNSSPWNITSVDSVTRIKNANTEKSYLNITTEYTRPVKRIPYGAEIQFKSTTGIEQHTGIPASQKIYAQGVTDGNSLIWAGPDQDNPFSWGPAVNSLEYDGSAYPYDANGRLVPRGTGNTKAANTYNEPSFFRNGFTTQNNLTIYTRGLLKGHTQADLGQKLRLSPMRESSAQDYTAGLGFKRMKFAYGLTGDLSGSYHYSEGSLLNHGANLSSVLKSLMLTPPTFDNSNGLSAADALKNNSSWLLPGGGMRAYAPTLADNPYHLLSRMPGKDTEHQALGMMKLNYQKDDFKTEMNTNIQKQWLSQTTGSPEGSAAWQPGRLSEQDKELTSALVQLTPSYAWKSFNFWADYQFAWMKSDFEQTNRIYSTSTETYTGARRTNELSYGARYEGQYVSANISNKHYFSTTTSDYVNFFPSAGIKFNIHKWLPRNQGWLDHLSIDMAASRGIYEAPLLYGSLSALSTDMSSNMFNQYFEYTYISSGDGLKPEISNNYEVGLVFRAFYKFELNLSYINHTVHDFIAPVQTGTQWQPDNLARVNNSSFTASASYRSDSYYDFRYNVKLMWGKSKSMVRELYGTQSYIPLAGFSNIQTVLAEDRPVGAIYGSAWLRDDQGRQVIGNDGFPETDPRLQMIGDPTPDWTASIWPTISWRDLSLNLTLEYRKGGDVWNGTRAAMDYYGMSGITAADRNTRGYVFEGVTASGQTNTKAVDFYNPALPLQENRWVRYGEAGVGEAYIEDASWLRLSELSLAYRLPRHILNGRIHDMKLAFTARNLLLWTPYTGVDPSSAMFNYASANGLDLFNLPSIRSFMFSIELKFW